MTFFDKAFRMTVRNSSTIMMGLAAACGLAIAVAPQDGLAAEAPADPGKAVVSRACQTCHDLSTITQARHSAAEWPAVIKRMRDYGANLTDADAKLAQDYLIKTYAKGG
jgi:cytochrome c5